MKPMLFAGIVFLFYCPILNSQNLINNPSFDEVRPYSHGENHSQKRHHFSDNVRFWDTPSGGTPDIHMDEYLESPKYAKEVGSIRPRSGESMIMVRVYGCYENSTSHCREYIQTKTKNTLIKGQCYEYEYHLQSQLKTVRINGLGIGFNEFKLNDMTQSSIVDVEEVIIEKGIVENEIGEWTKVSGSFKPKNDYNHIIIGNYLLDEETETRKIENGSKYGHYYIDDIALYKVDCATGERETKKKSFVLNEISFEVNSHLLNNTNKLILEKIYNQIEMNPYESITINGYTDNSGTNAYNLELSQKRAESVLEKLKNFGIPESKLKAIGHGNTNPIDFVNKSKNRRVEIVID